MPCQHWSPRVPPRPPPWCVSRPHAAAALLPSTLPGLPGCCSGMSAGSPQAGGGTRTAGKVHHSAPLPELPGCYPRMPAGRPSMVYHTPGLYSATETYVTVALWIHRIHCGSAHLPTVPLQENSCPPRGSPKKSEVQAQAQVTTKVTAKVTNPHSPPGRASVRAPRPTAPVPPSPPRGAPAARPAPSAPPWLPPPPPARAATVAQ